MGLCSTNLGPTLAVLAQEAERVRWKPRVLAWWEALHAYVEESNDR